MYKVKIDQIKDMKFVGSSVLTEEFSLLPLKWSGDNEHVVCHDGHIEEASEKEAELE